MTITTFAGKTAVITGAGSGMGRALAQALAIRGCQLAICDINEAALEETAVSLGSRAQVSSHVVDVAVKQQVEDLAAQVERDHGGVHMVFNNAGVSVTGQVSDLAYEDAEWLMGINFWGVVYGSKAFLPYLQQQQEAAIVNTSSIFGTIALPTQSFYNASKFAVRGFTYALRQELKDSPISVCCVQPGGVKTNIVRSSRYVQGDNSAPTLEEVAAKFEGLAGLTSAEAAEQILRGVLRNKAQILVGRDARFIALLERIVPIGYQRLIGRFLEQADPDDNR